jgi:hypothetical protein
MPSFTSLVHCTFPFSFSSFLSCRFLSPISLFVCFQTKKENPTSDDKKLCRKGKKTRKRGTVQVMVYEVKGVFLRVIVHENGTVQYIII